jgi:polar amino acid transport system substrate-binding protein
MLLSSILLICLLWHNNTFATIKPSKIRIATGQWPPYLSAQLHNQGCVAQLIRDAFAVHHIEVKFVFMHWLKAYARAQSGVFDATAYWFDNPSRRKDFLYSKQHITLENSYFFYHKNAPIEFNDWHDLSGKTIIINKGFQYSVDFFDHIRNFDIRTFTINDEKLNFKMLYLKRGDLTILSEKTSVEFLKRLPPSVSRQIVKHSYPPLINLGYVLFSRNSVNPPYFKQAFDTGFKQIMENAHYRKQYLSQCSPL